MKATTAPWEAPGANSISGFSMKDGIFTMSLQDDNKLEFVVMEESFLLVDDVDDEEEDVDVVMQKEERKTNIGFFGVLVKRGEGWIF